VTQQNAALVEEAAAAAESMEEQAQVLMRAVGSFKLSDAVTEAALPLAAPKQIPAPPLRAISAPRRQIKELPAPQAGGEEDEWAEF